VILVIPPLDEGEWPTLGPLVWRWISENLCYGPGDLIGKPIQMDEEWFAILCRLYQVWPQGHEWAGRRRFKRGAISRRKGRAKTELAAWLAAAELHPRAPVRCVGWYANGQPKGGPVTDPYIPLVAYTEEQGETTIYGALKSILEHSKVARDFDIGLERIMRRDGSGRAEALAAEPNARDGARTTFQVFEETHRWYTPRLKRAYQTMMLNIPKRRTADAWSLEVTTAYAPGEGSIAEATFDHAKAVSEGRQRDTRLFFSHRQAPDEADISTPEGLRAAVIEASGEIAAGWSDVDGICSQFDDPNLDHATLCRLWLNQIKHPSDKAFSLDLWKERARASLDLGPYRPPNGAAITMGFDGARYHDATGIVGTEIETGFQWKVGCWEKPPYSEKWEVPQAEVEDVVAAAFARWNVVRFYCDPPYWETVVATWSGKFGEKRVVEFLTNRYRKMADAVRSYSNAMRDGHLSHDGDADFARHVANAHKRPLHYPDDQGQPLYVISKARPDSLDKIDLAVAGVLSWEARRDVLSEGLPQSGYNTRAERGEEVLRWV
jgi:phage terminase large subunit-like protein